MFGFTGLNIAGCGFPNLLLFVQAAIENTRANDILKQAPFLVPFTSRVKIFTVSVLLVVL